GNLSITQSVLGFLNEGLRNEETGEIETIMNAPTMFQAAQRVGRAIRMVRSLDGPGLDQDGVKFEASFLFGGQISQRRLRLFMIYA
ncbi:hypothetical protein, partial [Klebsiella pneumoniae]|uniref:hypothetical protein n=1 Tax=Klebsiella pneumoniae TaxID=573 RepID=UPI003F750218